VLRVAFLCDHLDLGGQELSCLAVLRGLDRSRFAPYLYAFRPGALLPEARALDIPIVLGHDKPGADETWSARDEAARQRYQHALGPRLSADRIDVGLVYAWRDAIAAARAADLGALVERVDGDLLVNRVSDKSAFRRIICQSRTIRDSIIAQRRLLRCRPQQLVVIPNGIDLRRFDPARYDPIRCREALGLAADDFVVGAVARLAPQKNFSHLLRAIQRLAQQAGRIGRSVRLVIAGPDFGCRAGLEAEASQLEIADRVIFLGARSDVPEILRALDVFAITSIAEGVPSTLLEAAAMGLPIVATAVGSIPEVLDNNGCLVSVLDPEDAAAAMLRLLQDPELRLAFGRQSRRLSRKYDLGRMLRRYEEVLYEAVVPASDRTSQLLQETVR
jgi:glycosyltransferase involved in cell wall biosynthesis